MYDLLLKGGTIIDPSQGLEASLDLAISDGRIVRLAAAIPASEAATVLGVSGKLVTPGLIDLHTHVYWGATGLSADADEHCLKHGVTTVLDCGSAGSDNFAGFKRWIADAARARVFCYLNLSSIGLVSGRRAGELANPAYADPEGALAILRGYPDLAVGLKLRLSAHIVGGPCLPMLRLGRQVAEEAGVPMMVHIGNTFEPLPEILALLRTGDILSHCLTGLANGLLDESGRILPAVREARERGVVFDSAHGRSHFSYRVTRLLLDQGFPPDVISTDLTWETAARQGVDLPLVMTRMLAAGISLVEVVAGATLAPARALSRDGELGTLRPGAEADVAVLRWQAGEFALADSLGETRTVSRRLAPDLTIRAGGVVGGN